MSLNSRIKWFLQGTSHHLTMRIGMKYGDIFPMYFVCGFPRSGTSWLSELIADYYNLPRPRHYYLPIAFASVIHTHVKPSGRSKNTFYIYRDGRDCYASAFNKLIKLTQTNANDILVEKYRKLIPKLDDRNFLKVNFNTYLYHNLVKLKKNWADHVEASIEESTKNPQISLLRFEDLLDDPITSLTRAISEKQIGEIDNQLLRQVIEQNSFSSQMRRPVEQHRTILNKGKRNNWIHFFNNDSYALMQEHCGYMLRHLKYIDGDDWDNLISDEIIN